MGQINVTKRDGSKEPLDISKGTRSLNWAIGDKKNVSLSEIEVQSNLHFFDGIETSYITDIYIKTCDDLASLRNPEYDEVARNLKIQRLYKRVFGSTEPISLLQYLEDRVNEGHYSKSILYAKGVDYLRLSSAINHKRDFNFTSSGLDALLNGYGICDMETPQFMFMAIAIDTFRDYHKDKTEYILKMYEYLSKFYITLPSPEMRALRTDCTDYASCIVLRMGDSISSWKATSNALIDHTTASAGVGVDIADVASLGDKVKNGKITHSGKIPVLKSIDADISKASQNGRRGSATANFNFFDPEVVNIFSLKSPRMPVEDRINDLSYSIKVNELLYKRAKENKPFSLFSVRQAPELLDAFYSRDIDNFTKIYEELEEKELYTEQLDAREFLSKILAVESSETSAYYLLNIDEMNSNTPHTKPITMANICIEYMTAIEPLTMENTDTPNIGVCVLGNVNQGILDEEALEPVLDVLLRAQSHIMTRQEHPTAQANIYVDKYHDVGIGLSNHAYWLAKQGFKYGNKKALEAHNKWMEHFAYYLHKSSMEIAKEIGPAEGFKYHDRLLPVNRYKRTLDELVTSSTYCDWESLDLEIQKYGMYNCGLSMVPPAETSAGPSNQTTGLEPIRNLLTIKDKSGVNYKQFAPEALKLSMSYDLAYERDINKDFMKHVAVTQKWIDKGISANTFHNPELNDGKVRSKDILDPLFLAKHYGV